MYKGGSGAQILGPYLSEPELNDSDLRLSPPEDQAGVIHAISPIWMKVGQIKGFIQKL